MKHQNRFIAGILIGSVGIAAMIVAAHAGTTPQDAAELQDKTRYETAIIEAPPAKYDHGFAGKIEIVYSEHGFGSDHDEWAYTQVSRQKDRCVIHITLPGTVIHKQKLDPVTYLQVFLHERAHCNGWVHGPLEDGAHR